MKHSCLLAALTVSAASFLLVPAIAHADDSPNFAQTKLTGDWGGERTKLYNQGVDFNVYYKLDLWKNISGGVTNGFAPLDNLDMKMSVDGDKAFGLPGSTFFVYLLNNFGRKPNGLAGTNGGVDNIEVPTRAFKLYEAWYQQEFWDGKVSVLAGLHDYNSEFYVTDTSGIFLNPTYGIGTEMAATGVNGPSIFPYTSMAVRLAVKPTDNTYVQAAIFDGVPGDPNKPHGTHIEFNHKDGTLQALEGGIRDDNWGHYGIGVWKYTTGRPDLVNTTVKKKSSGLYLLADKSVYNENGKDISAFARYGVTDGKTEQYKSNWSVGVVGTGFIPSRPMGQLGFAMTQSTNSSEYRTANAPVGKHETQYELTYKDMLTPWLSIQPDLQYTVDPGTTPGRKNDWIGGIRFGIDF